MKLCFLHVRWFCHKHDVTNTYELTYTSSINIQGKNRSDVTTILQSLTVLSILSTLQNKP
jgi:hypothetical protein